MADESGMAAAVAALDMPIRNMLAEDLPQQLAAICEALDAGNVAAARQEVHAVRGSAAFCKLTALCNAAATLESSLLNNERNAAYKRAFENNIESVLHALEHAKANTG